MVVGGIIAGCQTLISYVVVVRRALSRFGKIRGVKPRDKLNSTGPSYWVSLVRREMAWEFKICGMSSRGFEQLLEAV